MKINKRLLALSIIGLLLTSIGCDKTAQPVAADGSPGSSAALDRVSAGPPVRKTLTLTTQQPGRIEAFDEAPLFSKLAGYVGEVKVDIGDRVMKDQLLLQLFVPEYKDELEQKRGLLAQAEAEFQQSEAALIAMEATSRDKLNTDPLNSVCESKMMSKLYPA
ncbi:MAG: biotin/lipoyl-binding protein [Aureliella sp.]